MAFEPMDEDDQGKLVSEIRNETTKQCLRIASGVSLACRLAASVALCAAIAESWWYSTSTSESDWETTIHFFYSACVHLYVDAFVISRACREMKTNSVEIRLPGVLVLILLNSVPFVAKITYHGGIACLLSLKNSVSHPIFYALILGNILTSFASWWIQYEANDTKNQLSRLEKARYHYKSI